MDIMTEAGKIVKTHGVDGTVKVMLGDVTYTGDKIPSFLYIELESDLIPHFINSFEVIDPQTLHVRFEDWDNKEAVNEAVRGKLIFVDLEDAEFTAFEMDAEVLELDFLLGLQLKDQNDKLIGEIEDVLDLPNNILLKLQVEGNETLIPLHDDLVIEVSEEEKYIKMEIAEGLLELYTVSEEEE